MKCNSLASSWDVTGLAIANMGRSSHRGQVSSCAKIRVRKNSKKISIEEMVEKINGKRI